MTMTATRTPNRTREARLLIWTTARILKEFSTARLVELTELPAATVQRYLQSLLQHGYVALISAYDPHGDRGNSAVYRLEKDTGLFPPQQRSGRWVDANLNPTQRDNSSRLWQAMRELRAFDSAQLASITSQNQGAVSKYLKFLADNEYLRVLSGNASGKAGSWITYRLVNDTGPLAPMRRKDGSLYDPNVDLKALKERAS